MPFIAFLNIGCQNAKCTYNYAFEKLIKEDLGEKCNFYLDDEAQDLEQLVISFAQMLIDERNASDSFMGKFMYMYVFMYKEPRLPAIIISKQEVS